MRTDKAQIGMDKSRGSLVQPSSWMLPEHQTISPGCGVRIEQIPLLSLNVVQV